MSLQFELRHPKHAVGEFTATIQFTQPVDPSTFTQLGEALRVSASALGLPAAMNFQIVNVAFGGPPAPTPSLNIGYQRFGPDGNIEASIICDPSSVTYSTRNYLGWNETRNVLSVAFDKLSLIYLYGVNRLHSTRLQYMNEFRAKDTASCSASDLLLGGTRWIAPSVAESDQFWHSHVGKFSPFSNNERWLTNVNCDVQEIVFDPHIGAQKYVKILLLGGLYFDFPSSSGKSLTASTLTSAFSDAFDRSHVKVKELLSEVISEKYLNVLGEA